MKQIKLKVWNGEEVIGLSEALGTYVEIEGNGIKPMLGNVEIIQFTGYKDSESNDLYEGDVLEDAAAMVFTIRHGKHTQYTSVGRGRRLRSTRVSLYLEREDGAIENISECQYGIKIGNAYEGWEKLKPEIEEIIEEKTDIVIENQVSFI